MTKTFALLFLSAALMGGGAAAQTAPANENTTNLAPKHRHHPLHQAHKPGTTTQSSTQAPSSSPSSASTATSNASSSQPQTTTSNAPATAPSNPDEGKPGVQNNNTTNMHTPGSENPADTGPTAPKN